MGWAHPEQRLPFNRQSMLLPDLGRRLELGSNLLEELLNLLVVAGEVSKGGLEVVLALHVVVRR